MTKEQDCAMHQSFIFWPIQDFIYCYIKAIICFSIYMYLFTSLGELGEALSLCACESSVLPHNYFVSHPISTKPKSSRVKIFKSATTSTEL